MIDLMKFLVFVRCFFGTKLLLVFYRFWFFLVRVWENFARRTNLM